jgi:hypothetical protein
MEIKLTIYPAADSLSMGDIDVDFSKPVEEMSVSEMLTALPALLGMYTGLGTNLGFTQKVLAKSAENAILSDNVTQLRKDKRHEN